jgi:hypothetical protein
VTQVIRPETPHMKNHEAQLPSNQTLNDETRKKNLYKRIKNKKITIKIMRIKIKIKKKQIREKLQIFNRIVKLKRKITVTKE